MRVTFRKLIAPVILASLIGCGFVTTSAAFSHDNDEFRMHVLNSAFFDIGHIRLVNVTRNDARKEALKNHKDFNDIYEDKNYKNAVGRGTAARKVKLKVSDGEDIAEDYRLYVDPLGGVGKGETGEKICVRYKVSSRNGKIYSVLPVAPYDTHGMTAEKVWKSDKSNPQIVTVFVEVEGDLRSLRCKIDFVRRRQND